LGDSVILSFGYRAKRLDWVASFSRHPVLEFFEEPVSRQKRQFKPGRLFWTQTGHRGASVTAESKPFSSDNP
jgi:hypothetical protein